MGSGGLGIDVNSFAPHPRRGKIGANKTNFVNTGAQFVCKVWV